MALRPKLRGEIWYAIGTVRRGGVSKRIRQSLDTTDEDIAYRECKRLESVLRHHRDFEGHTLREAVDAYVARRISTSDTTMSYLRKFCDGLGWGDMDCTDIDGELIEEYVDERLASGASQATVRRELNAIFPVFRLAHRRRWMKYVPDIERPQDGEPRLRALDEDEYNLLVAGGAKLTAELKGRGREPGRGTQKLRRMVRTWRLAMFLVYTGARIGEAVALDWGDVRLDVEKPYLILRTRKRKFGREDQRAVPVNERLAAILRAIEPSEPKRVGQVFDDWRNQRNAGKAVQELAGFCGIEDFQTHDLRRTFATRLLEANVSPRTVADLLGHKTLSMIMRYMVPPERLKEEAVGLL